MSKVRTTGIRAVEIGNTKMDPLSKEADKLYAVLYAKVATKNGGLVGEAKEYHTDIPPSIVFIEEIFGESVSSSFLRDMVEKDETGNDIIVHKRIEEQPDRFHYPDNRDCLTVCKDIFDSILDLSDKYKLTDKQKENFIGFFKKYISKYDALLADFNANEIIESLKAKLVNMKSDDSGKQSLAVKAYNTLIWQPIVDATVEFSKKRTDLLQWDAVTVSENFSSDPKAYGREATIEEIDGIDVRKAYFDMSKVCELINTIKYLALKESQNQGLKPEDLTYNPEWVTPSGEFNPPKSYLDYKATISNIKYSSVYRNWIAFQKSKSTLFGVQMIANKDKRSLASDKYQTGYHQIKRSNFPNSKFVKFTSILETGVTNDHPDFVLVVENYPDGDIRDSRAAMTYMDPGTELYGLIGHNEDKSFIFNLFGILNKDIDKSSVRKLKNELTFDDSVKSFINMLNKVENVNCEDNTENIQYNKTWLEKLVMYYPNIMDDMDSLFGNILGLKSEGSKIDLGALDLGDAVVQPEVQQPVQPEVQPQGFGAQPEVQQGLEAQPEVQQPVQPQGLGAQPEVQQPQGLGIQQGTMPGMQQGLTAQPQQI